MGLQRSRVPVVLRRASVVMLVGRGGSGRCKVRVGMRMRVVYTADVVRVLLELDEGRLGRGNRRYAAAAVTAARVLTATDGRILTVLAVAASSTATNGTGTARVQGRGVHGITTCHRRRRARVPLLLLLLVSATTTAAPSEGAPDLPVIQRDGCSVHRTGGKVDLVVVAGRAFWRPLVNTSPDA